MNFAAQFFYEVVGSLPEAEGWHIEGGEHDPFWQSEEERLAISMCQGVLIEPERLKDFGEEEEPLTGDEETEEETLNGEVKMKDELLHNGEVKSSSQITEEQQNGDVTTGTHLTDASSLLLHTQQNGGSVSQEAAAPPEPPPELLHFDDISAAAIKIQAGIQRTPCTYSRLSKQYGMEIYLKKEQLQYTGTVKERGVLFRLASLTLEQQKKGVIVASDCGFSMAVAHHAVELNIPVLVIMPVSVSPPRLRTYRDYGAVVISFGSAAADSLKHARHLARENGYLCLEEDDSVAYLAGLGSVAMEIHEQLPRLDAVVVPAAGRCGLLVGIATAIKHLNAGVTVIGVEPEGFPLLLQPVKSDSPVKETRSAPNKKLFGDMVEHSLNSHTVTLAKTLVDKVISVREEDLLVAMLRFQEFEHSTVDTEGAMGLAAILAGQLPELKGKKVAVVVSSANMELDVVRRCVDRALVLDQRVGRFMVPLGDLPGDLAKLLDLLAREDVRLLDVCRRGHSDRADLFKAQVECVVETRDRTQSSQLRRTLQERYPTLCWLD